jgi:hypothetical protein
LPPELLAEYDHPVGIGKVIEVNTEKTFEIEEIVEKIKKYLGD